MERLNNIWIGLGVGLVGPLFGVLIFYLILFSHKSIPDFVAMISRTEDVQGPLLAVSLTFNLIFFFLGLRKDYYYFARGIIMSLFVYAPFIVYFKYF